MKMKLFLISILIFLIGISPSFALKICIDCDYVALQKKLTQNISDKEKLITLASLIEAQPEYTSADTFINQIQLLLELNKKERLIDSAPYNSMLNGFVLWKKKSYRAALKEFITTINFFDNQKKIMGFRSMLSRIRIYYNYLNLDEEQLGFYTDKLHYYQKHGPSENMAACYHGLADYYSLKFDLNRAINNYLKASEIFKPFSLRGYFFEIGNVGGAYFEWGNFEKAEFHIKKALEYHNSSSDYYNQCYCLIYLSRIRVGQHQFKEAMNYVDKCVSISRLQKDMPHLAISLAERALVELETNLPVSSLKSLREADSIGEVINLPAFSIYGYFEVDYYAYKNYRFLNEMKRAETSLLEAYQQAQKARSGNLILKYVKELSGFYGDKKNIDLAHSYGRVYIAMSDSISQAENNYNIAQFENEQKERDQENNIKSLKQERQIQDQALSRRNLIILFSVFAFVLVTILSLFIYRQLRINKKTLLTLKRTQEQLIHQEKLASLGKMMAGIAHEIQNPLNFVNNFSKLSNELIEEFYSTSAEEEKKEILSSLEECLKKIHQHGKRADSIVKGMLMHSRLQNNLKVPENINAIFGEALGLSYLSIRNKHPQFNCKINKTFQENLPHIHIVAADISRVMINLLDNAFYAMLSSPHPELFIHTKMSGNTIELRIKDNGTGIPEEIRQRVFDPFFSTKPGGEGTGLGLSISNDIIKAHGGSLLFETDKIKGTEFIIQLPL